LPAAAPPVVVHPKQLAAAGLDEMQARLMGFAELALHHLHSARQQAHCWLAAHCRMAYLRLQMMQSLVTSEWAGCWAAAATRPSWIGGT
jgi:hypothetical protein